MKYTQWWFTTLNFLKRDLVVRYADSFLGPIWIIAYPLVLTLISTVIFSLAFQTHQHIPYYLFALIGFSTWVFVNQTVTIATRALTDNQRLIVNCKFHTESIIFSIIFSRGLDYLVNLIFFFCLFFATRFQLSWIVLVFFPLILLIEIVLLLGVSLFVAALGALFRDVHYLVDIVLQILFLITPILYPVEAVPTQYRFIVDLNPLAKIIELQRNLIFQHTINGLQFIEVAIFSVLVLGIGWLFYKKNEVRFAETV